MKLNNLLNGIFIVSCSLLFSCQDDEGIEQDGNEGTQEPGTEEVINLALGKSVETHLNDLNGSGSNPKDAAFITDGDSTTYWESAESYKHSILIDLGNIQEVSKVIVRWFDKQGCNAYNLNFGKERDKMTNVLGKNNIVEDSVSIFEGFREETRYVEFVVRGRLDGVKTYKISEIEVYNDKNEEQINTPEQQIAIDTITNRLQALYLADDPDESDIQNFMDKMQSDGSSAK